MKIEDDDKPSQALQLGFELALKDRDAVLREKAKASEERDNAIRQLQQVKSERDQAINSLENLTGKPAKLSNTKKFEESPTLKRSNSPSIKAQARSNSMESESGEVEELYCVTPLKEKIHINFNIMLYLIQRKFAKKAEHYSTKWIMQMHLKLSICYSETICLLQVHQTLMIKVP
ncbi:hypothetical protein LOTGIDRAFT_164752 [Lottia gigantea]|uniref:Uncharacterized protein n=1 Tax=Lottia gigantea TaxID=225164 RepID=V4A413_LOTGI|nr:hypothetical protein LOTGIDRAFT_164752 [Lottia gigantea]ESO89730.1 hypothetical protein LOTGIDRAFT_164752 [Lottia gigantea]